MPPAPGGIPAPDCGRTPTQAILLERPGAVSRHPGRGGAPPPAERRGAVYRQTVRGEAPTTVEAPFEDVTRGVLNAVQEVEELSGRTLLEGERIVTPGSEARGGGLYVPPRRA